jgi:hypothetical protein
MVMSTTLYRIFVRPPLLTRNRVDGLGSPAPRPVTWLRLTVKRISPGNPIAPFVAGL